MIMTYYCNLCGFLFFRTGDVHECPSCEGRHFRPATPEEAERLQLLLKTGQKNDCQRK